MFCRYFSDRHQTACILLNPEYPEITVVKEESALQFKIVQVVQVGYVVLIRAGLLVLARLKIWARLDQPISKILNEDLSNAY